MIYVKKLTNLVDNAVRLSTALIPILKIIIYRVKSNILRLILACYTPLMAYSNIQTSPISK